LQGWVEDTLDEFLADAFNAIEARLQEELGYDDVEFEYDTKLTLPVELTLGYLYRRALDNCDEDINPITEDVKTPVMEYFRIPYDKKHERRRRERMKRRASDVFDFVEQAERVARLCTEALLDGDMRDAINDDEYEDFETNLRLSTEEKAEVACVAQSCLRERVEHQLAQFPDAVAEQYDAAVNESNAHQATDEHFRALMTQALESDDPEAIESIETEYKYAEYDRDPDVLTQEEQEWPYSKTQYERVGVIYDGMIEMFRAAGITIEDEFKHAIVLSIIGAQIWLDDIDDFDADWAENQLTPVTAEYIVADSEPEAYERVVEVASRYLDEAIESAVKSESNLTGIAAEYIYLSGNPDQLPRYHHLD